LVTGAAAVRGGFVQFLGSYIEPMPLPERTGKNTKMLQSTIAEIQARDTEVLSIQTAIARRIRPVWALLTPASHSIQIHRLC
jgi:hypothetical protein